MALVSADVVPTRRRPDLNYTAPLPPPIEDEPPIEREDATVHDLRSIVSFLCYLADAEYDVTASVLIEPNQLTVTTFQRNENGLLHVHPETREPVVLKRRIKIQT